MIERMRLVLQLETKDGQKFEGATRSFHPGLCTYEDARVFGMLNEAAGEPETDVESLLRMMVSNMQAAVKLNEEKDLVSLCEKRLLDNLPPEIRNAEISLMK
jgi:hypothetical protein